MNRKEQKIARLILKKIKEKDSSAEIILYGSHARGDSHPDSDWIYMTIIGIFY
jgi:predicted nucleotidyltransferase